MAASILLYLLKANVVLLLFAAAYFGLLRRLTFFSLNRFYLLFTLLFAAVYPALPMPALLPAEAGPPVVFAATIAAGTNADAGAGAAVGAAIDWAAVGVFLYAAGAAVLLARLVVQLLSLRRLRRRARPAIIAGQSVRVLAGDISPFSFGRSIYLNPDQHPGPELAAVLRHEQVHVRQGHTLDVLLAQLAQAAAWCNPATWLLARALLDNLEYLADQAVLQTGLDRRAYQYSLLRLSHAPAGPSLVSHFTFPTLKNRVLMMNTPLSSTGQLARYFVAGPLVMAMALGFGAALTPAAAAPQAAQQTALPTNTVYYVDGILVDKAAMDKVAPGAIASINMLKGEKAQQFYGSPVEAVMVVTTTANANSAAVRALNERMAKVAPLVPGTESPASTSAIVPAALAYITKTYPDSRIAGVTKLTYPSTGQTVYKVQLVTGRRPFYAFFDEQGNVVKH